MPSFKLALLALAASLVSAQIDLSDIPTCALEPAISALGSSGCAETDIACICNSSAFLASLVPAVEAACDAADLCTAETFAVSLCASAGVTLTLPSNACATTSSAPPASTSAPPASTSAPPATTSAPPASTSAPPASSASQPASSATGVSTVYVTVPCSTGVSSSAVVVPTTPISNLTVTATKSAKPSVFTGAAAATYVSSATMFGGLMAALAMLL